jgi:uncharacterized membrane protein
MLPENQQNERRFDAMLKKALKEYHEPAQQEFTRRLMDKVQTIEQQRVLKKVIWQERALLAACILLPIAAVILVRIFPALLLLSMQLPGIVYLLLSQVAANIAQQWQLWMGYAAAAVVMMYAVYEILLADN